MKKPISSMTAADFAEMMAATGYDQKTLAEKLDRSGPMVSLYLNGKRPIPKEVEYAMHATLKQRTEQLQQLTGRVFTTKEQLREFHFEERKARQEHTFHTTEKMLLRRLRDIDPRRTYPPYRLSRERFGLFARALAAWNNEVIRRLRGEVTDATRIKQHQREQADIKCIAAVLPRQLPFDVVITWAEWDVVSRALRWAESQGNVQARSLYKHWRIHKGTGYPYSRAHTAAADTKLQ